MQHSKIFSLPFLIHKHIAKNTYSFFFDRTNVDVDFLPGQYLRMTLPHTHADERGTNRYFTIASSPLERAYLMVTTKMIQSTFKETLHNLTPGQEVQFFGPMGKFLLDEKDRRDQVLIAGGVGVTPFHSMMTYAAKNELAIPLTLFVSFTTEEEVIFYEELTSLTKNNKKLRVIYTVSDIKNLSKQWQGEKGRFSQSLFKKYIPDLTRAIYSVVGSSHMVEKTKEMLFSLDISEEQIRTEDFTGY